MTSLVFNGTGIGSQDFVVSGFYGPGGWAAWCISAIASWAPILLEDYTHNLHLVAYALYMSWAAMDTFRLLSLDRTFDALVSKRERLDRGRFFSIDNGTDTMIFQEHRPSDSDTIGLRSVFAIPRMGNFTWNIQGAELHSADTTVPGLWDLYTIPTTKDLTSELQIVERRLKDMLETVQREESLIWNQAHQLQAALAVLNLGTLHSWVQLLVCIWKTHKVAPTERAASYRRRNLITLVGLVSPSIIQLTDLMFHNRDIMTGLLAATVWTTSILIITSCIIVYSKALAPQLPSAGIWLACIFCLIWSLVIVGFFALLQCSIPCTGTSGAKGPRCGLMPRTASKITELDQAFAGFAALLFFFYDFRFHFWKIIKFLQSHYERLFHRAQPSSPTSVELQPVQPPS